MITNGSEGVVKTYEYDAWGNVVSETGDSDNQYKFTGRRDETEETGLMYYRARYYDPDACRFISQDPFTGGPDDARIGYSNNIFEAFYGGISLYTSFRQPHRFNRYVYCENNPVSFIDPLGLFRFSKMVKNKFPKVVNHMNNIRPTERKYKAFGIYGRANKDDVNKAFRSGAGPEVNPKKMVNSNGYFIPNSNSQVLNIKENIFNAFENNIPGSKILLDSTIEHELTHYFDDQNRKDYPGEEGQLYEQYVYGEDIDTLKQGEKHERKQRRNKKKKKRR